MEKIIVAFKSRGHTVRFYNYLREIGVGGTIVNTPKEANVGCGLSVESNKENYPIIKKAIFNANLSSYIGCFLVKRIGDKITIRSI